MSVATPDPTIVAIAGVPLEVFTVSDYTAQLDAGGINHVELLSPPVSIPIDVDRLQIVFNRVLLPDTRQLVVKCRAQLSLDGGLTWSPQPSGELVWPWGAFPIAFTAIGGISNSPIGQPFTQSDCFAPLPVAQSRMVRMTLIPLQSFRGQVLLTVSKAQK